MFIKTVRLVSNLADSPRANAWAVFLQILPRALI